MGGRLPRNDARRQAKIAERAARRAASARATPGPEAILPEWLRARVLHLDRELMVLDKPTGLPVSARRGESLEAWLPTLRMGRKRDPQPAHRLDADTAGCLVLGRTGPMLAALNAMFADRRVGKTYWAVLRGALAEDAGAISAPLRKVSTPAGGWRMEVHPEGDAARTGFRVLGRTQGMTPGMTLVELRPETGRTHQLRVHCATLGAPILGDAMYGGGPGPLHLLAREIVLPLTPELRVTAPVPGHMRAAVAACGVTAR